MDLSAIGQQFGLNEQQTRAALDALVPVVAAGIRRNAQSPAGLQDIFRSVLTGGHDQALDNPDAVQFDQAKAAGDDILGQIFGSKDVSRGVANQLSATSGLGAALIKKLLPIVATIVMGQMARNFGGGSAQASPSGGLGGILKDIFGGGAATPDPVPRRSPAPSPDTGGGSLQDILNDILNGGGAAGGRSVNIPGGKGGAVVKQFDPGQVGDILKEIFGQGGPGGGSGQWQVPNDAAAARGRRTIDDATGGGTRAGTDADILLDGVDKAIRRGG